MIIGESKNQRIKAILLLIYKKEYFIFFCLSVPDECSIRLIEKYKMTKMFDEKMKWKKHPMWNELQREKNKKIFLQTKILLLLLFHFVTFFVFD